MRVLVLGGTRFVGRHMVEALRAGGHTVTVFNRGQIGLPWDDVEHLAGDRETGDLESLRGRDWDVCLDVSAYLPQYVRASVALLADRVARYAYVSTASVYDVTGGEPIDEESKLCVPPERDLDSVEPGMYGALKVACEQEAERVFAGRLLTLRPGIVAGPFDPTNRFDWWVGRLARGGEVLAPGSPAAAVQVVDGRDLAQFAVALIERETTGVFNVSGEAATFGELLPACRAGTGSKATLTWVGEEFLLAQGVAPFDELPLWLPEEPDSRAFYEIPSTRARAAGLELRPLADTARDTWEWLRAVAAGDLPATVPGWFVARGLDPAREAELLRLAAAQ
jgi:2'-hydroxyisoflavone reductase